ncbi:tRNA (adenosine(37)-N6)-dimethylallyltransferase MiaA [Rubellimicrobium sp. CFH 75288]|uniref:tRNA (adenosine(37)-N6)-dimethylallyltransferase MiaA n=1 Tax=Rubellimicrobium sp. CFH 75288 TaxID=2697034 RepID=UPI00141238A3|nr:tRNA (adenosine(37)-N6)-dimethylallyltransferase MiaA [Rubellimicrobium sp. CFH 75288]NAZ36977.1 tRNA (adenosine(37)-N6)-dimethylallyltransferase MiaA [Rubellimicrobium sp. CFH 75288]
MDLRDVPPDRPVLIAGPTASGKSALALHLARTGGGVVVNADALQVYAGWRVLTARPSPAEEAAVPHALFGHVAMDESYSVGRWLRELAPLLDGPRRPIVVGGTGLYLSALTEGLAPVPPVPSEVRAEADRLDLASLLDGLDARTRAGLDPNNRARVQRAWEVLRATGRGLAEWQAETPPPLLPPDRATRLVLRPPVAWLDARIAARFDAMLEGGAIEEVRANLPLWRERAPAFRVLGAAELRAHLLGRLTLPEARAAAILATRRYAKRQRTWFRGRMADWIALDPSVPVP